MPANSRQDRKQHYQRTLLASTTDNESNTGADAVRLPDAPNGYAFVLDVTADESTANDTLDVYVQTRIDDGGGENWVDVVHFTQHAGNAGAKQYVSKVTAALANAEFEVGSALDAANVRNLIGDEWRVRYAIVDDSTSASFTFSVTAIPM